MRKIWKGMAKSCRWRRTKRTWSGISYHGAVGKAVPGRPMGDHMKCYGVLVTIPSTNNHRRGLSRWRTLGDINLRDTRRQHKRSPLVLSIESYGERLETLPLDL